MTEEELDATGALVVDEDQDELLEELSLEERKEGLKKARWNVFLYLGVAAILFFFALFPMPFSADYDGLTYSAEKDIGLVWGLPLDGEDLFDVPMRLTVLATTPPAVTEKIDIGVYVIQQEDCTDYAMSEKMEEAKSGDSHAYQYQEANQAILAEKSYEFEFNIDPGQYCIVSWYIYENGDPVTGKSMELSVDGKLYPNQFFGGLAGLVCLSSLDLPSSAPNATAVLCASCSRAKTNPPNPRCCPKPAKLASPQAPVDHLRQVQAGPHPLRAHQPLRKLHPLRMRGRPLLRSRKRPWHQANQPHNPRFLNPPTKGPLSQQKTGISSGKCLTELTTKRSMCKTRAVPTFHTKPEFSVSPPFWCICSTKQHHP